jgi:hypothetical protein
MSDLFAQLVAEPRSLTEELFGRSEHLTIFVSSKMRGGVYVAERRGCAHVVDGTGVARAWYWERDAKAGPYCSENVCLAKAATADGLILILGDELTSITRQEFEVAHSRGVATFVFIDERQKQDACAQAFIESVHARHCVTKNFANAAELETHVSEAVRTFQVQSWRRATHATWKRGRKAAST